MPPSPLAPLPPAHPSAALPAPGPAPQFLGRNFSPRAHHRGGNSPELFPGPREVRPAVRAEPVPRFAVPRPASPAPREAGVGVGEPEAEQRTSTNFPGTNEKGGAAPPSQAPSRLPSPTWRHPGSPRAPVNIAYLCREHLHPGIGAQESAGGVPHPPLPLGKVLQSHPRHPSTLPLSLPWRAREPPARGRGERVCWGGNRSPATGEHLPPTPAGSLPRGGGGAPTLFAKSCTRAWHLPLFSPTQPPLSRSE